MGVWFFKGVGGAILRENKLNSEVFNEKKSLLTKIFSSVSLNSKFKYF